MRRDFLKSLGIDDKETIDKILDENSSDIGKAKGELETYKNEVSRLKSDLSSKESEIEILNNKIQNQDDLNATITQLKEDKSNLENELNGKLNQLQKTHAIEGSIRDAKGKNVKAVMALLDLDKIGFENGELSGISEQIDSLKNNEETSFLFGSSKPEPPKGTEPHDPPAGNGGNSTNKTLAELVAKALNNNK